MSILKVRSALETALNGMAGIIPAATISSSSTTGVITTSAPHGLTSGLSVTIRNHTGSTPSLNASYLVIVTGANTFTLQNETNKATITISVGGTGGTVLANLTAWENMSFQPIQDVPYQKVDLIPAMVENPTFGSPFHRERGYLQVSLFYPLQKGSLAIMTRAELIRSTFPRNSSFIKDEVTVIINRTPEIGQGRDDAEGNRYMVPVKIPYYANIFS